jgi:tetratricopeptide (TPR) repeat protein
VEQGRRVRRLAAGLGLLATLAGPTLSGNADSAALRARASADMLNLDRDRGIAQFRQAIEADPQDAAAYRGLATGLWLSITFGRGNMTVDDFLGRSTRRAPSAAFPPPPADTVAAFQQAVDRALAIGRARAQANPRDAEAHYQIGSALGLQASYVATVEGSALRAFRTAREAYEEQQQALELDPRRKDAGLIVGTYRYIVSDLSLPARWIAYMAGFGGDKERGIRMIEEAAAYGGDNQDDARFALVLIYNRERQYAKAVQVLDVLRARYPRNRLAWLESGSTSLRAGRAADAERVLNDGLLRFASDDRPRMFGENALWHYKRGASRAALGRTAEAELDLNAALGHEGRKWVHGRSHLEIGKLALKSGNKAVARQELQTSISLCESDNDIVCTEEARRLLR